MRSTKRLLSLFSGLSLLTIAGLASAAGVEVVSRTGAAGSTVAVRVKLVGEVSDLVAGTQNDIAYNPAQVSVPVAGGTGKPSCRVNPDINKKIDGSETFGFGFLKGTAACNPTSETCDGLRAIVLSTDNVDAIAPGADLFTCDFAIAAGLANDTQIPLSVSNPIGSDPSGQRLAAFSGQSGVLTVQAGAGGCVGDCNSNGEVTIGELQIGLNMFFGTAQVSQCPSFDVNTSGDVTIGELQQGLNNFFAPCP